MASSSALATEVVTNMCFAAELCVLGTHRSSKRRQECVIGSLVTISVFANTYDVHPDLADYVNHYDVTRLLELTELRQNLGRQISKVE